MSEERGFLGIFFKSQPQVEIEPVKKKEKKEKRSHRLVEENHSLKNQILDLKAKLAASLEPEPVEDEDDA